MKLLKYKYFRCKLKRLEEDLLEVEFDYKKIIELGGTPEETKKRKDRIIKDIEDTNKLKEQLEMKINCLSNEFDKEIVLRRYKGESYGKIAYTLDTSFYVVHNVLANFSKELRKKEPKK